MFKKRPQLDAMLARLEREIPLLMQEYTEASFPVAFTGHTHVIVDSAGPEDLEHVRARIRNMLASRGLAAGDSDTASIAQGEAPHLAMD